MLLVSLLVLATTPASLAFNINYDYTDSELAQFISKTVILSALESTISFKVISVNRRSI